MTGNPHKSYTSSSRPSANPTLADKFPKTLVDDIYRSSFKNQTGVSLKYMMDFGSQPIHRQLMVSAQFLHKELPVRLAHRVAELENLPLGLSSKEQVRTVRDWYVESYDELKSFPPIETMEDEAKFTGMIEGVMNKHANVVPMIARGVLELKIEMAKSNGNSLKSLEKTLGNDLPEISQFLDGFYMSRIGIRMLIGQHVALHDPTPQKDHIGLICTTMSPRDVVSDAIEDARSICMRQYGDAPEVEVFGGENFTFAYVPGHLHQMLFELVKNSLRAVSDKYAESLDNPPPIRVVIAEGAEDVTIKISDEGGGDPTKRIGPDLDVPVHHRGFAFNGHGRGCRVCGRAGGVSGLWLWFAVIQAVRQVLRRRPAGYFHGRLRNGRVPALEPARERPGTPAVMRID